MPKGGYYIKKKKKKKIKEVKCYTTNGLCIKQHHNGLSVVLKT